MTSKKHVTWKLGEATKESFSRKEERKGGMKLPHIQDRLVNHRCHLRDASSLLGIEEMTLRQAHPPLTRPSTWQAGEGEKILQIHPSTQQAKEDVQMLQITPFLYIGDSTTPNNLRLLLKNQISCVISATAEVKIKEFAGIRYLRVPVKEGKPEDIGQYFVQVAEEIEQVAQRGGTTLIHCKQGFGRSAALALAYLYLKTPGNNLFEAYQELKKKHRGIYLELGLMKQLFKLEEQLEQKRRQEFLQRLNEKLPQLRILSQLRPPPR